MRENITFYEGGGLQLSSYYDGANLNIQHLCSDFLKSGINKPKFSSPSTLSLTHHANMITVNVLFSP